MSPYRTQSSQHSPKESLRCDKSAKRECSVQGFSLCRKLPSRLLKQALPATACAEGTMRGRSGMSAQDGSKASFGLWRERQRFGYRSDGGILDKWLYEVAQFGLAFWVIEVVARLEAPVLDIAQRQQCFRSCEADIEQTSSKRECIFSLSIYGDSSQRQTDRSSTAAIADFSVVFQSGITPDSGLLR